MRVEYLDLADYLAIAAEVTGLDVDTVTKIAHLDLADSALHAPSAGNQGALTLSLPRALECPPWHGGQTSAFGRDHLPDGSEKPRKGTAGAVRDQFSDERGEGLGTVEGDPRRLAAAVDPVRQLNALVLPLNLESR